MAGPNLDIHILRTLVTAQQLGGFNRAAQRVGAVAIGGEPTDSQTGRAVG
jgi:hypothetical protein